MMRTVADSYTGEPISVADLEYPIGKELQLMCIQDAEGKTKMVGFYNTLVQSRIDLGIYLIAHYANGRSRLRDKVDLADINVESVQVIDRQSNTLMTIKVVI